jgi:uncharacterized membrane protein
MNSQRTCRLALTVMGVILAFANSAWACPMCKLALETDDAQPRAYMASILFMMGTIFTLFGVVSAFVWWVARQERRAMEAAGYTHLFENGVTELGKTAAPDAG